MPIYVENRHLQKKKKEDSFTSSFPMQKASLFLAELLWLGHPALS